MDGTIASFSENLKRHFYGAIMTHPGSQFFFLKNELAKVHV